MIQIIILSEPDFDKKRNLGVSEMKKFSIIFIVLLFAIKSYSQQVPLGQWRTHLPYNHVLAVDQSNDEIYCATSGGLFTINKNSGELNKYSTISGLAETDTKIVAWNETTQQLIIAYSSSNIDLLKGEKVYHLPEIFDKSGLGNKSINAITFKNDLAYLSCGFGIVVYNLTKREVKDTYYIGNGGTNLNIFQIAINGDFIYAASADGIYQANLTNPLLADYKSWQLHGNLQNYPGGISPSITSFNNLIYGVFGSNIYKFNGNNWALTQIFGTNVKALKTSNNKLLSIANFRIISYDNNENILKNIQSVANFFDANDVLIDQDQNILIADGLRGLVKTSTGSTFSYMLPNGPNSIAVKELKYVDEKVLLSPGAFTSSYSPAYNNDGFSFFENEIWTSYSGLNLSSFVPIRDIVTTALEKGTQKKYLGSFVNGLIEFNPDLSVKIYNQNNSTLQTTIGDASSIRVDGVALDNDGNLWVSQYGVSKPLSVKSTSGQWRSFSLSNVIANPVAEVTGLTIDQENNKWLIVRNLGLVIFNGSVSKKIGFDRNNGAIPGANVNSLTLDLEGSMWIGTNKGVAVFYNVNDAFNGINAEIPNVVENGFLKPLLGAENINCIAIDGANRKWIGTDNGAWLFSADGTKQIGFFNTANSPLLNNKVLSICIDDRNGEVFFGTASGIISYKGDATAGVDKMGKITVYPNPVRPGFSGTIGIKGLSNKANVKITDINGVLIYQTTSNGGQATWNGKNFSGEEASSGVYLVLIVNQDGSDTAVAKILIVR